MIKDTFLKKTGFVYCPKCKSSNIIDGPNAMQCEACGFRFYFNCAAAVSGIIIHGDEMMFIKRKNNPGKGMLDLPGGFSDYNERLEDSVKRELFEEISADTENIRYFASFPNTYLYRDVLYHTMDCFFTAVLAPGSVPKAGDDAAEIVWIPISQIDFNQMAFDSVKRVLKAYIKTV